MGVFYCQFSQRLPVFRQLDGTADRCNRYHHLGRGRRDPSAPGISQIGPQPHTGAPKPPFGCKWIQITSPARPRDHSDSQFKITSHSFRKAGVSVLALASGVSIPNITNWYHWRSAEMPWHYADQKYVTPPKWRDVFAWMKQRPAQNLWA